MTDSSSAADPPNSRRARYNDLRLSQLRSFCEVCERGGFAAAGEAMHLTTPAVWEQVRSIEAHDGVELLERDGRNVRPTAERALLFDMLRRMLSEFDSTHEVIQQSVSGNTTRHSPTAARGWRGPSPAPLRICRA